MNEPLMESYQDPAQSDRNAHQNSNFGQSSQIRRKSFGGGTAASAVSNFSTNTRRQAKASICQNQKSPLIRAGRMSQVEYSQVLASNVSQIRGKDALHASVKLHQPNVRQITLFLTVMSLAMMASQSGTYMNICTNLLEVKYNWDTQHKKDLNEALMNTLPAVGLIFGSGLAGKFMSKGRKETFILACIVGILGSAVCLVENWAVFLTAKFVVGVSIGLTGVVVARYIEEYVPLSWFGISQAIALCFLQAGIFIAHIMGAILPDDSDHEALAANTNWRIIFSVQPFLCTVTIILFYIFVGTDTPRFYIMQGDEIRAKQAISKIYRVNGDEQKLNNIYAAEQGAAGPVGHFQEEGSSSSGQDEFQRVEGNSVSMSQALCKDERYTRSSWTAILIMTFQCLTGYYAIIAYSTILIRDSFAEGDGMTARQGVFIIQGCNFAGSIFAIYFIAKFGRRTMFLIGQGGIALALVSIAITTTLDSPQMLLALICVVAFLFQLTLGPMAPLYAAEVCTDVALGAVMITEDIIVLLQDFLTPMLLSSPMQPVGVFLMFGAFSVIGFIYIYAYVPETCNYSEQQKKEVFMPGALYGRKLEEGEVCHVGIELCADETLQQIKNGDQKFSKNSYAASQVNTQESFPMKEFK